MTMVRVVCMAFVMWKKVIVPRRVLPSYELW